MVAKITRKGTGPGLCQRTLKTYARGKPLCQKGGSDSTKGVSEKVTSVGKKGGKGWAKNPTVVRGSWQGTKMTQEEPLVPAGRSGGPPASRS